MTLADALTLSRFGAAALLWAPLALLPQPAAAWTTLALFLLAAATDALDGYCARRFGGGPLGRALDPVADKALGFSALVLLISTQNCACGPYEETWTGGSFNAGLVVATILLAARDLLVSGLREAAAHTGAVIAATRLAKGKTTVLFVAVALLLAREGVIHQIDARATDAPMMFDPASWERGLKWAGAFGLLIATGLSMVSGLAYARAAVRGLEAAEARSKTGEP